MIKSVIGDSVENREAGNIASTVRKQEGKGEVGPEHKTSRAAGGDWLPPARLCLLWVSQPHQTPPTRAPSDQTREPRWETFLF